MKIIKIESCKECKYLKINKVYTADSFENVVKWFCLKSNKKICLIETFDKNPEIPNWCKLDDK